MPPSDESHGLGSIDLGDRVIALLRYYGQGNRSAFVQQIARKVVSTRDHHEPSNWHNWWQIYHRLSDFGLITQTGRANDVSWQWTGDRLFVLRDRQAQFTKSCLRIQSFAELYSRHDFQEEIVYHRDIEGVGHFSIRFLVSEQYEDVLDTIKTENLAIQSSFNDSILEYLPSAQDVFGRTARLTATFPEGDDIERRSVTSSRWIEYTGLRDGSSCLLRKARDDRPGFRYWLIEGPGNRAYEVLNSDWLPLLLWWVGRRQWLLAYETAKRQFLVPNGMYFSSPTVLRHALIQKSMRWPRTAIANGDSVLVFTDVAKSDVDHFARLYAPALKVKYVQ